MSDRLGEVIISNRFNSQHSSTWLNYTMNETTSCEILNAWRKVSEPVVTISRLPLNDSKVRKEFHNGDIFSSMIAFMLFCIALFKASQKFYDLISVLPKVTNPLSFPLYRVSNIYRSFVRQVETSHGSSNIPLIGCQSD